jgi:hypothetical protein
MACPQCRRTINGLQQTLIIMNREDRVSVIADVHYNRVKGYLQYTTGYIANTCNKHRSTQCDYIKGFYTVFFLF